MTLHLTLDKVATCIKVHFLIIITCMIHTVCGQSNDKKNLAEHDLSEIDHSGKSPLGHNIIVLFVFQVNLKKPKIDLEM